MGFAVLFRAHPGKKEAVQQVEESDESEGESEESQTEEGESEESS